MKTYDSIVIGGGILGCATAYELLKLGQKVLVIEKEFLASGSTGRCICGIRQQFSTPGTVRTAMESVRIFEQMEEEFGTSVEWYAGGYLFLAQSEEEKKEYLRVMRIQQEMGLDVKFLEKEEVLKLIPDLAAEGIIGGTYCSSDGQANPFLVVKGYADGIKRLGGDILIYTKVIKINTEGDRVVSLFPYPDTCRDKEYVAPIIINAAGAWANEVNKLVKGVHELSLFPERHEALITEPTRHLFEPMIVSYSPNCYFQQLHTTGQIIGCYTPESPVKGIQSNSSFEFISEFPSRALKLIPKFAELKVLRSWAGWYTMTPDGNPIIGESNIRGFWVIGGTSGHGFMFGPALGKSLAELICKGKSSIPIDEFSISREFKAKEIFR